MRSHPLVSIIIPTYKRQDALSRAIASALNQTYKNVEILISDDEKSAETKAIVESIAKNDDRVKYIENYRSKGVSGARNSGIFIAKGEYCVFLDDDDEIMPEAVELFVNNTPKDAAFGYGWRRFCVAGDRSDIHKHGEKMDFDYLSKRGSNAAGPNIFVPKSHLIKIDGYDESMPTSEDYDLCLRLLRHFGYAKGIEKVIANYHDYSSDRLTKDRLKCYKGMRSIALKHGKEFTQKARALYLYRARRNYYGINPCRAFAWLPIGKALDELRRYLKYKLFGVKIK
ncbi:MAG: glycosyltransferase [Helicobacteraceae bacterium]|nr:glycosyltransferase [Helicobacteraceae bacterium]